MCVCGGGGVRNSIYRYIINVMLIVQKQNKALQFSW